MDTYEHIDIKRDPCLSVHSARADLKSALENTAVLNREYSKRQIQKIRLAFEHLQDAING